MQNDGDAKVCTVVVALSAVLLCVDDGVYVAKLSYTHTDLLNVVFACKSIITSDIQCSHNIPLDMVRPPGSALLQKQPHSPALKSVFLTICRSQN